MELVEVRLSVSNIFCTLYIFLNIKYCIKYAKDLSHSCDNMRRRRPLNISNGPATIMKA